MSTRTELEKELYEFLDTCDPSGRNTERMRGLLKPMDDKTFYKYMDEFFSNDKKNIQVGYEAFDNPVTVQFAEKIAKKYDIPLYEIVYKPYLTGDVDNPPASVHPVLVMDVPIKRLKQMVQTKSHTSISNTKRDAKTGQVTGHDKTARVTDVEAYSLIVQELYSVAQESFGPMADDEAASFEMQRLIQKNGEVSLKDLPRDPLSKVTTNTVFYMMLGSCVSTNLIEETGHILPITLKSQEDKSSTIDRG